MRPVRFDFRGVIIHSCNVLLAAWSVRCRQFALVSAWQRALDPPGGTEPGILRIAGSLVAAWLLLIAVDAAEFSPAPRELVALSCSGDALCARSTAAAFIAPSHFASNLWAEHPGAPRAAA